MGAPVKELCEAANGKIVQAGGKVYCQLPAGTPEAVKAGIAKALQPKSVVRYYDLANPPQEKTRLRRKNFRHLRTLTAVTTPEFFHTLGVNYGLDYNFDQSGIKEDMEILGIRALIDPQSYQDVDSTYCTVFNQFTSGSWTLMKDREPRADGRNMDICPTIKWEPGAAANQYTTSIIPADFYWFRRELGAKLDKIVVKTRNRITVQARFLTALTLKSGMMVGFELACRVASAKTVD